MSDSSSSHTTSSPVTSIRQQATIFCPVCWERVPDAARTCPACAIDIVHFLAGTDYGALLIDTLRDHDARRHLMAAWILGERREERAVPALRDLTLADIRDVYLSVAAVRALGRIGTAEAVDAIRAAQYRHPARIVRRAAASVLAESAAIP